MSNLKKNYVVDMIASEALKRAQEIIWLCTSVIADPYKDDFSSKMTKLLFEFGFYARRLNEMCKITNKTHKFNSIDVKIFNISSGDPGNWETDYYDALNYIAHAQDYVFGFVHLDHRKIYKNYDNLAGMYVKIDTDQRTNTTISLAGLVLCFMDDVLSVIKQTYDLTKV